MYEPINTAVIAAAGQGTRMFPATKVVCKELFPLVRLPAIARIAWEFIAAGIRNIIIVVGRHNHASIAELFNPLTAPPAKLADDPLVCRFQEILQKCSLSIVEQSERYGNGTPLRLAADVQDMTSCVYAFGDDIVIGENATSGLLSTYAKTGSSVIGTQEIPAIRKTSFGIVECEIRDEVEQVTRFLEKPAIEETTSNLASFGRYVITRPILEITRDIKPGRDGELWLVDAIIRYLQNGGRVFAMRLTSGKWYTVGDPRGYAEAVQAATEEESAWDTRAALQVRTGGGEYVTQR